MTRRETPRGEVTLVRETRLDLGQGMMHKTWTYFLPSGERVSHQSAVRLYLPLSDALPEPEAPIKEPPPTDGRALKILLVEDDPDVATLAAAMLMDLGHAVRHVDAYGPAVELMRSDAEIDLLITDLVMPGGRSGADVAQTAAELRPGTPIILCSGYAAEALRAAGSLPWPLLRKPYSAGDLAKAIAEVLTSSSSLTGG